MFGVFFADVVRLWLYDGRGKSLSPTVWVEMRTNTDFCNNVRTSAARPYQLNTIICREGYHPPEKIS